MEKFDISKIKVNDVFHARYTIEYQQQHKHSDLRHCFEGLLVAKQVDDKIILFDTFWGIGRTDNKWFELSKVNVDINIEFYCNLDEIEKANSTIERYYDEKDIVVLSDQHACVESCKYYYLRKGAVKSKDKMKEVLFYKKQDAISKISYYNREIKDYDKKLIELEKGNLEISI